MRRTREQSGFTVIEVMIAALVILAALGIVVTTAVKIRGLSTVGETKAAATKVAQQELDRLRSIGWERLQMDAAPTPTATSDPKDPLSPYYLTSTTYRPSTDLGSAGWQPLVIGTAPDVGETDLRDVKVTPTPWQSGQSEGMIYRFVTYGDDTACGANCPSAYDYKRVTVAVTVTKPVGAISRPVVISTEVANPSDAPVLTTSTAGTPPATFTGLTYYPYDTPATFTTRQAQTIDHNRRDTQTKPDLMGDDPPPDPNPDPANPTIVVPTYNYTKDTSTVPTCTLSDGTTIDQCGASIKKSGPATPSCSGGGSDKEHEWVSNILTSDVKLTGNGTVDMYARTMSGLTGAGRLCITVYDVPGTLKADGSINGTQTAIGTRQSAELNPFYTDWQELQFTFRFLPVGSSYYTVTAGRRIGIYVTAADHLAAPNDATTSTDLTIMYDHPDYPSSFGLETQQ